MDIKKDVNFKKSFKVLTYANKKLIKKLEDPSIDLDNIFNVIYLWDDANNYMRYLEDEKFREAFRSNDDDFLIIDWLFINDLFMCIEAYSPNFLLFFQKPNEEIIKDLSSFHLNEEEEQSIKEGYKKGLTLSKIISERSMNFIPYYMIEAFNFMRDEIHPPSFRSNYKQLFLFLLRCFKKSIERYMNSFVSLLSLEDYFEIIDYDADEFHLYRGFNCESCPITRQIRNNQSLITTSLLSFSLFEPIAFYYASLRLVLDIKIPRDKYKEFKYAYISANRKKEKIRYEYRGKPIYEFEDGSLKLLRGQFEIIMNYGAKLKYLGESKETFKDVEYTIKKYEFQGYNDDKELFINGFDFFYNEMNRLLQTSGGNKKTKKIIKKYIYNR